jgi:hypothetical protein
VLVVLVEAVATLSERVEERANEKKEESGGALSWVEKSKLSRRSRKQLNFLSLSYAFDIVRALVRY